VRTACLLILLSGCSLIPLKRSQQEAFKGAEALAGTNALTIRRVVEGEKAAPVPHVTITGSSNTVTVASPPALGSSLRLTGTPPTVSAPTPYREEIEVASAGGITSKLEQQLATRRTVSLPMGVSLALAGVGLLIAIFAVKAARRSSAAIDQAVSFADSSMATAIRRWRTRIETLKSRAAASTDQKEIADALREAELWQSEITGHEIERGKLQNRVPYRKRMP